MVHVAPWHDGNGEIGGIISVHEDVTAIVRAQHEVESSKERMSYGMSITQMMIWELDFEDARNQRRGRLEKSVPAEDRRSTR